MGIRVWPTAAGPLQGVGNYNSAVALDTRTFVPNYAPVRYTNRYVEPPAIADPFDDEFDGGSDDLALRGFSVLRTRTNPIPPALTRGGPINPYGNPAAIPATQYLSSLGPDSKLRIQLPPGRFFISKPVSVGAPPWSATFACKIDAARDSSGFGIACGNFPAYASFGGSPSGVWIHHVKNGNEYINDLHAEGSENGFSSMPSRFFGYGISSHVFLMNASGSSGTGRLGTCSATTICAATQRLVYWVEPMVPNTTNMNVQPTMYFGFYIEGSNWGAWFELDYLRRYPAGIWPF